MKRCESAARKWICERFASLEIGSLASVTEYDAKIKSFETEMPAYVRVGYARAREQLRMMFDAYRRVVDERVSLRSALSIIGQMERNETLMKQHQSKQESLLSSQQSELTSVRTELLIEKKRVQELQSQLTAAQLSAGEQKRRVDEQTTRIAQLQAELTKISAECSAANSRAAEYSSNIDYWRTHFQRQQTITQTQQSQIDQLNAQVASLQRALNEARSRRTSSGGNARNCNHTYAKCKAGECSHDCCHR